MLAMVPGALGARPRNLVWAQAERAYDVPDMVFSNDAKQITAIGTWCVDNRAAERNVSGIQLVAGLWRVYAMSIRNVDAAYTVCGYPAVHSDGTLTRITVEDQTAGRVHCLQLAGWKPAWFS
ncbi:hypothetical protein FRC12_002234 [Ceratobasidium sp. 428]|nr:hypothetical protein FRC12_002234 [Ceratobasidium sp. 428]